MIISDLQFYDISWKCRFESLSLRKKKEAKASFFCIRGDENTRVGVRNRRSRLPKQESLSPQKEKQTEAQIYLKVCLLFLFARMPAAAQGMDKVNSSLFAAKGVNQAVTRFTPFFTPKNQCWVYLFGCFLWCKYSTKIRTKVDFSSYRVAIIHKNPST